MSEPRLIMLIPVALLAMAALISSKPTLSALLLLIESGLIALFIGSKDNQASMSLGPAIILCLFGLLVLCANIYIERCTPRTRRAIPKANIAKGLLLFFIFTISLNRLKQFSVNNITINSSSEIIRYDTFSIICLIFTIFALTISAFIIITIKNNDNQTLGQ